MPTHRPASRPHRPHARPLPPTSAPAWRALLAAWEVAAGSASERALARAVLADAARRGPALVRAARQVLAGGPAAVR